MEKKYWEQQDWWNRKSKGSRSRHGLWQSTVDGEPLANHSSLQVTHLSIGGNLSLSHTAWSRNADLQAQLLQLCFALSSGKSWRSRRWENRANTLECRHRDLLFWEGMSSSAALKVLPTSSHSLVWFNAETKNTERSSPERWHLCQGKHFSKPHLLWKQQCQMQSQDP